MSMAKRWPRFQTDDQLIKCFGISQRALNALRSNARFPQRDPVLKKTDSKAVDAFFDSRAGLSFQSPNHIEALEDGEENFAA